MKKIILILMAALLIFGQTGLAAEEEQKKKDYTPAAARLAALEIIRSTEGDPEEAVTKRELVKSAFSLLNSDMREENVSATPFVDVPLTDPDISVIRSMYELGYISGDENLKFFPDAAATEIQGLTVIINVIGFKNFAMLRGGYPGGYRTVATSIGISAGAGNGELTRGELYNMLNEALDVKPYTVESVTGEEINYTKTDKATVLSENFDIYEVKGVITANRYTSLTNADPGISEGRIKIDDEIYEAGKINYDALLGKRVKAYYKEKDSEKTLMYATEYKNTVTLIDSDDLNADKTTADTIYYMENDSEQTISYSPAADVLFNGRARQGYGRLQSILPEYGELELIDNDDNGSADVIKIISCVNIVVTATDKYSYIIYDKYKPELCATLDEKEADVLILDAESGAELTFEDIAAGDVVTIIESADKEMLTAYVSKKTVSGIVNEKREEDGELVIDGVAYKLSPGLTLALAKPGELCTAALDYRGRAAGLGLDSTDGDFAYGVLAGVDEEKGIAGRLNIKIFTAKGEWLDAASASTLRVDRTNKKATVKENFAALSDRLGELVRYKLSEKEIREIDTAHISNDITDRDAGELTEIDRGNLFKQRLGVCGAGTRSYFVNTKSVLAFSVPQVLTEYDKYMLVNVGSVFTSGHSYRDGASSGQYTHGIDGFRYRAYCIGEETDMLQQATALVFTNLSQGVGMSTTTPMGIITNIFTTLDKNGEERRTIELYSSVKSSFVIADKIDYTNYTGPEIIDTFDKTGLKKGDIIQYACDMQNEITMITAVYRHKSDGLALISDTSAANSTSFDAGPLIVKAKILNVDLVNKLVRYRTVDGRRTWIGNLRAPKIIVVNDKLNADYADISELGIGDDIVMRMTNTTVNEMVVFK